MGFLLDLSWQYFDIFLIVVLIALVSLLMSIFFKQRITLIIVMGALIIGSIIVVNQLKYTTFSNLYWDQLNEETVVERVTITLNDLSSSRSERKERVIVQEREMIQQILDDFSDLELKKDNDKKYNDRKFHLEIVVRNKVKEKHYSTTIIQLDVDRSFINEYRVLSDVNHLETIEELVEG